MFALACLVAPTPAAAGVPTGSWEERLDGCTLTAIEQVSVEKVLVPTRRALRERSRGDGIPDRRLPYDAQLWVRVRRR